MKKKQHNQPHNVLDSCKKVKEVDNVTCARTQIYDQKKNSSLRNVNRSKVF